MFAHPASAEAQSTHDVSDTDIIVVGKRYGEAETTIETEFDEEGIAEYSADSIQELMQILSPMIDGSDEQPVLIVNGKRIADPRDIRGFPPEALQRVEVLGREAAGQYGYAADKRVVNLVLKERFSGLTGQATVSMPTAGGPRQRDSQCTTFRNRGRDPMERRRSVGAGQPLARIRP